MWREVAFLHKELIRAIMPPLGLESALRHRNGRVWTARPSRIAATRRHSERFLSDGILLQAQKRHHRGMDLMVVQKWRLRIPLAFPLA